MARLAAINKSNMKKELAKKYYAHREELRRKSVNPKLSDEERQAAQLKLQKLPKKTSHVQVRNRCMLTGRSRGNYRKFKLCRIALRDLASAGQIPGMVKASW